MIERINSYDDPRFSQIALWQHGCFLLDGRACEIEIISSDTAVVRGAAPDDFQAVIDEFRFYTPQITRFQTETGTPIIQYPEVERILLPVDQIQPSQFYVDADKVQALGHFIYGEQDIVIQALCKDGKYIALDGHTRLYIAAQKGFQNVYAVESETDDCIFDFVAEAKRRGVHTPRDLQLLSHEDYEEKWNRYCDSYFAERANGE